MVFKIYSRPESATDTKLTVYSSATRLSESVEQIAMQSHVLLAVVTTAPIYRPSPAYFKFTTCTAGPATHLCRIADLNDNYRTNALPQFRPSPTDVHYSGGGV